MNCKSKWTCIAILFPTLLMTASCVAKKEKVSSLTSDLPPNWKKILSCQSESVEIDVDANDRLSLQVLIKDKTAFKTFDEKLPYAQIRNLENRTYRGQSGSGEILDSSQFTSVYELDHSGGNLGFEARKFDDTLVFRGLDVEKTGCSGQVRDNNFAVCEVSNYVFKDCKLVQ